MQALQWIVLFANGLQLLKLYFDYLMSSWIVALSKRYRTVQLASTNYNGVRLNWLSYSDMLSISEDTFFLW